MPRVHGLYAIVDLPHPHGLDAATVTRAVLAGASVVQLRMKRASTAERIATLAAMAPLCRAAGVPLFVNDDLAAALAPLEGIAGVHLGQGDPGVHDLAAVRTQATARAELRIGVSTHDLEQLRAALRQAPDYVAFGPVAPTRSKPDPDPVVGLAGLRDATRIAASPVVAIGGLDDALAVQSIEVGAAAVAVIGALVDRSEAAIADRARDLAQRLRDAARPLELDEVHARIPVLSRTALEQLAQWSDDLAIHVAMRLPARFRPRWADGVVTYRPSDVVDLLEAMGKRADESWDAWHARGDRPELADLVRLRLR